MNVLVTGASGWIGSALVPELIGAGHQVLALARSQASATAVAAAGASVLRGDLDDVDVLRSAAARSDGVIHLGFNHDFSRHEDALRTDAKAIEAFTSALEGSGRPLVVTGVTPVAPAGSMATETDEGAAQGPGAGRTANNLAALAAEGRGVRVSVVRIPRTVHGDGERHGHVPRLIEVARQQGVAGYVGDGSSRWPGVHVLDAAALYQSAFERAPAGSVLHAVGDQGVPVREIAEVIAAHLGIEAASVSGEAYGFLGPALGIDQPASSAITRQLLGWQPIHPGLIEDLEKGHYFT